MFPPHHLQSDDGGPPRRGDIYGPLRVSPLALEFERRIPSPSSEDLQDVHRSISLLVIHERGLPRLQKGLLSPTPSGFYLVLLPNDWLQADFSPFDGHGELVLLSQAEFLPLLLGDQDPALLVQGNGLHAHRHDTTLDA